MGGHHLFIYPIPIIIFNTLNAEFVTEWSTSCCVCEVFVNISFTDILNTATFIEKQFHISAVCDHHQAISRVF